MRRRAPARHRGLRPAAIEGDQRRGALRPPRRGRCAAPPRRRRARRRASRLRRKRPSISRPTRPQRRRRKARDQRKASQPSQSARANRPRTSVSKARPMASVTSRAAGRDAQRAPAECRDAADARSPPPRGAHRPRRLERFERLRLARPPRPPDRRGGRRRACAARSGVSCELVPDQEFQRLVEPDMRQRQRHALGRPLELRRAEAEEAERQRLLRQSRSSVGPGTRRPLPDRPAGRRETWRSPSRRRRPRR